MVVSLQGKFVLKDMSNEENAKIYEKVQELKSMSGIDFVFSRKWFSDGFVLKTNCQVQTNNGLIDFLLFLEEMNVFVKGNISIDMGYSYPEEIFIEKGKMMIHKLRPGSEKSRLDTRKKEKHSIY